MSCGVGHRRGSDPVLPWLWHRPAAIAPIRPLAGEPPYVAGMTLEKTKKKRKKKIYYSTVHRVPIVAQQLANPTSIHEDMGSIPGLAQWVKDVAWIRVAVALV